jgi:hypothetical protein
MMTKLRENCTICQTVLIGEYCHVCGQQNTGKKITLRESVSDLIAGIFSLEHSILATLWSVLRNPHLVIQNYWCGFRGYYHSPGKLAFYAAFLLGLHFAFIGNEFLGFNIQSTNIPPQVGLLALLLPLYSLTSKITFIRQKHSFLEHSTAMIYLFSTWIVVFIIIDIVQRIVLGNFLDEGMFVLFMIILFAWNTRVQSPHHKIIPNLLFAIVQVIVFLVIIAVIALLLYVFVPESMTISQ